MNASMPLWVEAVIAVLAVAGALAALVGSFGLLRLRTFFQRVHAPTLGVTLGTWSLTLATAVQGSFEHEQLYAHALLIGVFMVLTPPVTTIFLMRAAVFRERVKGTEIPDPSVDEVPRAPEGSAV
jgi:multicomponent K+:H+ antiporter subunit G